MRGSYIGSFRLQWGLRLLPFLFVEFIEFIMFLQAVIAHCTKIEKTSQVSVSFLGDLQMNAIHIT